MPPHQFYGDGASGSGAQLDGVPAASGTFIETTNEAGLVVGSARVRDGRWVIEIDPNEASEVQFRVSGMTVPGSFSIQSAAATAVPLQAETRHELRSGLNSFVLTGPQTDPADLVTSTTPEATLLFRWDDAAQRWDVFIPSLPRVLSSLLRIESGDLIWAYVE